MVSDPHIIEVAVTARSKADRDRLASVLSALADADSALGLEIEPGRAILKGTGEAHLDATIGTLRRSHGIDLAIDAPKVAYRETLTRRVEKDYTYKKQKIGTGQFARVKLVFEPHEVGGFESKIVGGAVPDAFIAGVAAGIEAGGRSGVLAGYPVTDVKVTLIDGAYHDRDSSAQAFEIASQAAFREALHEGQSILLEPIMSVEVTAPEAYSGFITGDLRARRGRIEGQEIRGASIVVDALVPFANTFGYVNQLRSGTQGCGTFTMRFSHYAPLPLPDDRGPSAPAIALRA